MKTEALEIKLENMRQLAVDRLKRIERLEAKVRAGEPGVAQLGQSLSRALERLAFEAHRGEELRRALNGLAIEAGALLDQGVDRLGVRVALDESDRVLALPRMAHGVACSCCGQQHSLDEWERLKFVGLQPQLDMPAEPLELRNCQCGTTLALPLRRLPLTE